MGIQKGIKMKKIFSFVLILFLGFNNSVFANINANELEVVLTPITMNSKLKKKYVGYNYSISNNTGRKINIINAQILNGNSGNLAYNDVEQGARSAIGMTWAIAGPVGLFTLGIGWLAGIVATPIVWICMSKSDKKANTESIAYTNTVPLGYLNNGETIHVKTLVPVGAIPQLKLTVTDDKTQQLQSFIK